MSAKPKGDDLEAVRSIVAALQGFDPGEQERILRWAREKVGLSAAPRGAASPTPPTDKDLSLSHIRAPLSPPGQFANIRTFIDTKNPQSDRQFAAAVAYFYKFEAPEAERKASITSNDLLDACRKVGRERIGNPGQTLINAHSQGYLDKAGERGAYALNTVGENLVAMTLPEGSSSRPAVRTPLKKKKRGKARRSN